MSFSKNYSTVLSPFVKKFETAKNEKEQKGVINNATEAVKKSKAMLEEAEDLPKDLKTVRVYFIYSMLD